MMKFLICLFYHKIESLIYNYLSMVTIIINIVVFRCKKIIVVLEVHNLAAELKNYFIKIRVLKWQRRECSYNSNKIANDKTEEQSKCHINGKIQKIEK